MFAQRIPEAKVEHAVVCSACGWSSTRDSVVCVAVPMSLSFQGVLETWKRSRLHGARAAGGMNTADMLKEVAHGVKIARERCGERKHTVWSMADGKGKIWREPDLRVGYRFLTGKVPEVSFPGLEAYMTYLYCAVLCVT